MSLLSPFVKVIKRMSSVSVSGGLSVSDSAIRYFRVEDNQLTTASLRLPPGIVENGRIKNKELAVAAFNEFRSTIPGEKAPEVVVSLGSGIVYSQFFTLPQLDLAGVKEAAELNLQMISPIPIDQAYRGYQMIGEASGGIGYEFLGGFVQASIVDDWLAVFKEVGIIPVVIEFQSLSVVRAASAAGMDKSSVNLIIDISNEGMDIMIVRKGNLAFDYFYSWKNIQGEDRTISFDKLKQIISTEVGKVMNFSLSRFGNEIKTIIVNAEGLSEKIIPLIQAQFPSALVSSLPLPAGLSPLWAPALGAFVRGKMNRSEDDLISLSPLTVIEEYRQERTLDTISLWGRVIAGVLIFTIFVMGAGDLFLRKIRLNVGSTNIRGLSGQELTEYANLSAKAAEFNKLVLFVDDAKEKENRISPFIEKLSGLNSDVKLTRMSTQSLSSPISINGTASSADAVSRFHNQLAAIPGVSDIVFPLSSLVNVPDGRVAFTMSFKTQSFDLR